MKPLKVLNFKILNPKKVRALRMYENIRVPSLGRERFTTNWKRPLTVVLKRRADPEPICYSVKRGFILFHLGFIARKPIFGVSLIARLKPSCSAIETS